MSTLHEAACCACLRVHWVETKHLDGTTSGRWLCTQCGREFAPGTQADAGTFRQLLEVLGREVGKTGESEGAVDVAERVLAERDAARADLATAANVITELREELDEATEFTEFLGNVVMGTMIDIERRNAWVAEHSSCAYCGKEDLRHGPVMQAHAEACEKHPMAAMKRERDAESKLGTVLADQLGAEKVAHLATVRGRDEDRRIATEEIAKRDTWNVELLGALRVVIEEGDQVQAASLPVAELRHHMRVAWLAAKRAFPVALPPMRWRAYNEPGTMFTREGELTADRQRSDAGRTMDAIHAEALRANK